ncbi:MAG: ubiquinol-cytochrome c reductase iron-sulfur subunit [Desulfobaccales bacterium]
MDRRRFLKLLASILGLSGLGAFLYPLMRFLQPIEATIAAKKVNVPLKEIPVGVTKDLLIRGVPSIIIHTSDKGYIALSRVCTHLGCLVNYHKERQIFICPCHAGIYDLEGNVISGPPPRPLEKFTVQVKGNDIVIG